MKTNSITLSSFREKTHKKIISFIILKYLKPNLPGETFVKDFIPDGPKYSLEKKLEVISDTVKHHINFNKDVKSQDFQNHYILYFRFHFCYV